MNKKKEFFSKNNFRIGGHRGSPKKFRENSIKSFYRAIDDGASFIELDLRLTSDSRIVINHDDNINNLKIKETDYKTLFSQNSELLLFETVINDIMPHIFLDIEIKTDDAAVPAVKMLKDKIREDQFIITSFLESVIQAVSSENDKITTGLLIEEYPETSLKELMSRNKASYILPWDKITDTKMLNEAFSENIPLIIWTVDEIQRAEFLTNQPAVRAIISNVPEKMIFLQK